MRSGVRQTDVNVGLTQLPTVMGVDWRLVVINVMFTLGLTIFLRTFYVIPVSLILHFCLVFANKKDPFLTRIIAVYKRQGSKYFPFRFMKKKRFDRPNGFGRNVI